MTKNKAKELSSVNKYLNRSPIFSQFSLNKNFESAIDIAVIIPAYGESYSDLSLVLQSLDNQTVVTNFLVIIIINHSKQSSIEIKSKNNELFNRLSNNTPSYHYDLEIVKAFDIPSKKAGVGFARKLD